MYDRNFYSKLRLKYVLGIIEFHPAIQQFQHEAQNFFEPCISWKIHPNHLQNRVINKPYLIFSNGTVDYLPKTWFYYIKRAKANLYLDVHSGKKKKKRVMATSCTKLY